MIEGGPNKTTNRDAVAAVTSIFLAPHLDDVAFSCGGYVAQLVSRGEQVLVVTCFTQGPAPGEPLTAVIRALHAKWNIEDDDAVQRIWEARRREDAAAVGVLGAYYRWLGYRDSVYRGGMYDSVETVMGHPHERDWETLERMSADVIALWQGTRRGVVHLPLGVGHHVDHQMVFMLAGALRRSGIEVLHYEDFPYAAREPHALELRLAAVGAAYTARTIDVTEHMEQRLTAMALYTSQLEPTFARVGPYRDVTLAYAGSVAGRPGRYAERLWSLDRPIVIVDRS